jgi:hypothetical protein
LYRKTVTRLGFGFYFFSDLSGRKKRIKMVRIGRKKPMMNQVLKGRPIRWARFPAIVGKMVSAENSIEVRKSMPMNLFMQSEKYKMMG